MPRSGKITQTVRQTMFTMGEVDEQNFKRTDFQDYLKAAQSLLNAEVSTTGLAQKRKGTRFLLNVTPYITQNSRLFNFVDNNEDSYLVIASENVFNIFTVVGDVITYYQTVVSPYSSQQVSEMDFANDDDSIVFTIGDVAPSRLFVKSYNPVFFGFEALSIDPFPAYDFGVVVYNIYTINVTSPDSVVIIPTPTNIGFNQDWVGGQIVGPGSGTNGLGYGIITAVQEWTPGLPDTRFSLDVRVPLTFGSFDGNLIYIAQPAWTDTLGYPKKVSLYQNRLWLGSTSSLPVTVNGSKINQPTNFDTGTGLDTDAIIYKLGQSLTGNIVWLNAGKQFEIYTENAEFVVPQDSNTPLTPSTFTIRPQSSYGCSTIFKPLTYLNDSYYVSKTGKAMINYHFDGIGQTNTSRNVSIQSSHLVKQPFRQAVLRGTDASQDTFIYFLNQADSSVSSFQYALQGNLAALAPVQFETDDNGNLLVDTLDMVTINNEVYFLKFNNVNGNYIIDKFVEDVKMDEYLDSTMDSSGLVTGLDELNGYTVTVVFEDQEFGQYLVQGGQIIVFNPLGQSGPVQVGLLYDFEIKTMFLFAGANRNSYFKKITSISVDYFQSLNFSVNGTLVPYQQFQQIQQGLPPVPQTGTATIYPVAGWNQFDIVTIDQSSPFDCQILGIDYDLVSSRVS